MGSSTVACGGLKPGLSTEVNKAHGWIIVGIAFLSALLLCALLLILLPAPVAW
jgi:hypothetical protein